MGAPLAPGVRPRLPWGRFLVVALLVGLDLWTKAWAFAWLTPDLAGTERDAHGHLRYVVLEPWLGVMLSCNPGAAFGQLGDWPRLLVLGRAVAIVVLTVLVWRATRSHWPSFAALVLVLAGAAGNLSDNLFFGCVEEGHPFRLVRDFIDVWFRNEGWGWDWHFPTFNVADSCITVGAVLWILSSFLQRERGPETEAEAGGQGA